MHGNHQHGNQLTGSLGGGSGVPTVGDPTVGDPIVGETDVLGLYEASAAAAAAVRTLTDLGSGNWRTDD